MNQNAFQNQFQTGPVQLMLKKVVQPPFYTFDSNLIFLVVLDNSEKAFFLNSVLINVKKTIESLHRFEKVDYVHRSYKMMGLGVLDSLVRFLYLISST